MRALLIDHDDSFTENLRHWLAPLFESVEISAHKTISKDRFDLIVLSPGPKSPNDYPQTLRFLEGLSADQPVLGVCLGMQMMTEIEKGSIEVYQPPLHGKKAKLRILSNQFTDFQNYSVGRYHSLKCVPNDKFEIVAISENDEIPMWMIHRTKKWVGFQFHPESFLTDNPQLLLTWLGRWIFE